MKNILSNLGICKRAGKLVAGFDAVCSFISKSNLDVVVFLASDASQKTIKEIQYHAKCHNVEVLNIPLTKFDVNKILNKSFAVLAVTDIGMANMIKKYL